MVLRVEIFDDPGVVDRVEFELRVGEGVWTPREGVREGDVGVPSEGWWRARFEAAEVWSDAPTTLEVRVVAYGERGGRVIAMGYEDPPGELELLEPVVARERERALRAAAQRLTDETGDEVFVAGLVGVQSRLSDPARLRAVLGVAIPFSRTLAGTLRVTVGPTFSPPEDRPAGAIAMGAELGLRFRSAPPRVGRWSSFLGPRVGAELRFPGVDAIAGGEAGVQLGLSSELALELGLIAGLLIESLDVDPGLGVTGGLRLGFRLGSREPEI